MTKRIKLLLIAALLFLCISPVQADILPPNAKGVRHKVTVEGLKKYPKYKFVLYPSYFMGFNSLLLNGKKTFWFRSTPKLYALTTKQYTELKKLQQVRIVTQAARNRVIAFMKNPSIPRSSLKLVQRRTVPKTSPIYKIVTQYEIRGIKGGHIDLVKAVEETFGKDGKLLKRTTTPSNKKSKSVKKAKGKKAQSKKPETSKAKGKGTKTKEAKGKKTSWHHKVLDHKPVLALFLGIGFLFAAMRRREQD